MRHMRKKLYSPDKAGKIMLYLESKGKKSEVQVFDLFFTNGTIIKAIIYI